MIQIKIPNYLRKVQLSASRRAKYFVLSDDLPDKYTEDRMRFVWKKRTTEINLYDNQTKEFVLSNPKSVGTPSYQAIAGNEIYARMHERKRMMIVDALKSHFKQHISSQLSEIPADLFPLAVAMEIHSPYGFADWDLDNLWIYHKCFLDSLRDMNLIPDDNVLHITQAGQTTFCPITESETPTMIFKITLGPVPLVTPVTTLEIVESCEGDPGTVLYTANTATIYTGKKKILFGAAKRAIRAVMVHALNNFQTVFVAYAVYHRYRSFFDENRFEGKVGLIITP